MADDKVSQANANYRFGGNVCHACANFVNGNNGFGTCKKVFGAIGENMLCNLFERMKNAPGTNASVKGV